MGQSPTEEELFQMIAEVDSDLSGSISFSGSSLRHTLSPPPCSVHCSRLAAEFLRVIELQKARAAKYSDESDMIDAFVACGGNPDKTGHVKREKLVRIIKHDFGLTIDIEALIDAVDTDGSGEIEFEVRACERVSQCMSCTADRVPLCTGVLKPLEWEPLIDVHMSE